MKRNSSARISPLIEETARHLGALLRRRRLARQWTLAELAERAGVGLATLKRMEKGAPSVSLGVWLSAFERLGLLSLLNELDDPTSAALLDLTRIARAGRKRAPTDLDF